MERSCGARWPTWRDVGVEAFPVSALQMETNARDVCVKIGNYKSLVSDGAGALLMVPRGGFGCGALDAVRQDGVDSPRFWGTMVDF